MAELKESQGTWLVNKEGAREADRDHFMQSYVEYVIF